MILTIFKVNPEGIKFEYCNDLSTMLDQLKRVGGCRAKPLVKIFRQSVQQSDSESLADVRQIE